MSVLLPQHLLISATASYHKVKYPRQDEDINTHSMRNDINHHQSLTSIHQVRLKQENTDFNAIMARTVCQKIFSASP